MKRFFSKKILILFIILLLLITQLSGYTPYITSRISSFIYIKLNYSDQNFKFSSSEYSPQFGDYSITYTNNSGESIGLMMYPKPFPILIRYDSIKQH